MTKNATNTTRSAINSGRPKTPPPCDKSYKLYHKDGNSTMLLAKGLTYTGCMYLSKMIKDYLEQHGTKLEGIFLSPKK